MVERLSRALFRSAAAFLHGAKAGQDIVDLSACLCNLGLCAVNMVQHHPVREKAVEKVIRKAQETVHLRLHIRLDGYIGQLGLKAAKLGLQRLDLVLRVVQMPVLDQVGYQAAAEQVERPPAFRAVQAGQDAARGIARRASGVECLPNLGFQRLLCGELLLKLQDALGITVKAATLK